MKKPFSTIRMKSLTILTATVILIIMSYSCSNDDDPTDPGPTLIQTFQVMLSAQYSVPANTTRNETGTATLKLYNDNSLTYEITVNNLTSTDLLTSAHIHLGDLVSTGEVSTVLVDGANTVFDGSSASGTVILTTKQLNDLQGNNVYVNVHSEEIPAGLIRGSIDQEIDFAMDVMLSPDNQVPAVVGRNETGIAYLRLTSDSDLYYKIIVNDLDMSDAITAAHIHEGAVGVNGGVFQTLASGSADINVSKILSLETNGRRSFLNDDLYINVHSTQEPGGLLRGQIR